MLERITSSPQLEGNSTKITAVFLTGATERTTLPDARPRTPLEIYLEEVGRYPNLTPYQEETLFKSLRAGRSLTDLGQDVAFAELIFDETDDRYRYAFETSETLEELAFKCNLGLVVKEVRRYPNLSALDLIPEGNLGLMKAVGRHDPDKGRFETYATSWIRGNIYAAVSDLIRPVHIPRGKIQQINRVRRIEVELQATMGRNPSEEELRNAVHSRINISDITITNILEVMRSGVMYPISFDKTITTDQGGVLSLYDAIPDKTVNVEGEALKNIENDEYKLRRRPSDKETAENMGVSISTARRALRRLVEAGLLPLNPRNPRTIDETGYTQHVRMLDAMVELIIIEDRRLTVDEIVQRLSDPDKMGRQVSRATVQRSISRFRKREGISQKGGNRPVITVDGRNIDTLIEELLQQDPNLINKELIESLAAPDKLGKRVSWNTVAKARRRLVSDGKAEARVLPISEYRTLLDQIQELLNKDMTNKQIAKELKQPFRRVKTAAYKLRKSNRDIIYGDTDGGGPQDH